jgi:F420-non-reducing hydrogenase iron-sulfur subunit
VAQLQVTTAPTTATKKKVVVFVCANCGRGGMEAAQRFGKPAVPEFGWNDGVQEVEVPCSGRLQPEHLLRPFEAGADAVVVVACAEGNCHYVEGSCRARVRCEYVGGLLDEIGLGRGRLMLYHLPGSSQQDMAVGAPGAWEGRAVYSAEEIAAKAAEIGRQVRERLRVLPRSGLRNGAAHEDIEVNEMEAEEHED